jgi:hypothetical protein
MILFLTACCVLSDRQKENVSTAGGALSPATFAAQDCVIFSSPASF